MEKSCGIILFRNINKKREYLILKYANHQDYWGLCKGTVEKGETEQQTALREATEETGLKEIQLVKEFHEKIHYFYPKEGHQIYKEVIYFLGEVLDSNNSKISAEHEELLWLPFTEAINQITHIKDQDVVKKSEEFLSKKFKL
ncbi:MAG: NUDIX domain-containing protein [Candidatus Woesearchaeota archaeon]